MSRRALATTFKPVPLPVDVTDAKRFPAIAEMRAHYRRLTDAAEQSETNLSEQAAWDAYRQHGDRAQFRADLAAIWESIG